MTSPRIGVLALQGDVGAHVRALRLHGAEVTLVRRPEELAEVDGLVLPGGESTAMSRLAVAFDLLEPLRQRVRDGLPAYGSCAGMILLADRLANPASEQQTIGGLDVTVRRNAFGRQVESFEAAVDFVGFDEPIHAVFIRAPWIEEVGDRVEVLARVMDGPSVGRIVAVRQGMLIATAFHPELTGDLRVHGSFVDLVRDAMGAHPGVGATEA